MNLFIFIFIFFVFIIIILFFAINLINDVRCIYDWLINTTIQNKKYLISLSKNHNTQNCMLKKKLIIKKNIMKIKKKLEVVSVCWDALDGSTLYDLLDKGFLLFIFF
jgi:hypothetical protein